MEYLSLGHIIGSFSLDGSFKVLSSTSFAKQRYKEGNIIYLRKDEEIIKCTVNKYRQSGEVDIVKVDEINTPEEALAKKGYEVLIDKSEASLPKNYYHYYELESCFVYDEQGNELGKVKKVEEYPAQITLRVTNKDKEFFVPFVKAFIKKVDIENKKIIITPIEGML